MRRTLQKSIHKMNYRLLAGLFLLPTPSFAATLESVINAGVVYLQGTLARSVGIAAIVITGYLCIYKQKLPKEQFVMVLVGLGIIFGASTLYSKFAV